MTPLVRWTVGTVGAAGVLVLVRLLSFLTYSSEHGTDAIVRLAWRARGETVRDCRRLTPAELAKLPVHMRQERVCEGRVLPYRLRVELDNVKVVDRLIHGAGVREDRPLYVLQDLPVRQGVHRLAVAFALERSSSAAPDRHGEEEEAESQRLATPAQLAFDTTLTVATRRILLVTYDEERERLVVRDGSER
ncbi:MAG TPA: hypothetical protein VJ816_12530 [Gemmatimonadales bacterium]|nr:hypothetical protein [Gemmatimonadales bacterium]